MLTDLLRTETRTHHERIEQRLGLPHSISTLSAYRDLLAGFYGFYLDTEPLLQERLADRAEFRIAERQKLDLLQQDLTALGLDESALDAMPRFSSLPPLESLPQAIGCLYVLEGSTLGGQVISAHFRRVLGVNAENNGRFFYGYGSQTMAFWRSFKDAANAYSCQYPEQDHSALESACATFESLEMWLCQNLSV